MRVLSLFTILYVNYCIAMQPLPSVEDLFQAIMNNKPLIVESMVKEHPVLIKRYGKKTDLFSDRVLALHVAAAYGNNACIKILLAYQADPNGKTKNKLNTPLHYVQSLKGARLLFGARAHIDQENAEGRTPLWNVFVMEKCLQEIIVKTNETSEKIAAFLLEQGADINKKDKNSDTLLHCAIHRKSIHLVDFLLRNNADQDQLDAFGITPFHILIKGQQNENIVEVFAKYGTFFFPQMIPMQLYAHKHESLVQWAPVFSYANEKKDLQKIYAGSDTGPMRGGIMCNQYGCIIKKVSHKDLEQFFGKVEVQEIEDNLETRCKKTILLVRNGDYKRLRQQIERFPFVTCYRDVFTKFMVKEAIENNDSATTLSILLNNYIEDRVMNIQVLDWGPKLYTQKGTFLHMAVFCNKPWAIKLLMRYNADCSMVDRQKRTPMMYAQSLNRIDCIKQLNESISEQFLLAFNKGEYKKSQQLLTPLVDCNVVMMGGNTLLHNMLHYLNPNTKKFINLLINKGADPNGLNEDEETPLWHLMKFNKNAYDIFELLLSRGARVDRPSSQTHYSLLGIAAHCKKIELVKLFLEYEALVTKKMVEDSSGEIKSLLKKVFIQQKCYLCNEHKDNLSDILCKNRHSGKFICIACNHADNNQCLLCSERLN